MSQKCPNIDSKICQLCEYRETCNVKSGVQNISWGNISGDISMQQDLKNLLDAVRTYVENAIATLREELLDRDNIDANTLRSEFRTLFDDGKTSFNERFGLLESDFKKRVNDLRDIDIAGVRDTAVQVRDGLLTINTNLDMMLDNRVSVATTEMKKALTADFDLDMTTLRGDMSDITSNLANFKKSVDTSMAGFDTEMASVKDRMTTVETAGYCTSDWVSSELASKINDAKKTITGEYTAMLGEYSTSINGDIAAMRTSITGMSGDVTSLRNDITQTSTLLGTVNSKVATLENAGYQTAAQVQTAMTSKLADYVTTSSLNQFKADTEANINSAVYRGQWSGNSVEYKKGNTVVCGVTVGTTVLTMSQHVHRCIKDHTSSENDLQIIGIGANRRTFLNTELWEDLGVTYNDYQTE